MTLKKKQKTHSPEPDTKFIDLNHTIFHFLCFLVTAPCTSSTDGRRKLLFNEYLWRSLIVNVWATSRSLLDYGKSFSFDKLKTAWGTWRKRKYIPRTYNVTQPLSCSCFVTYGAPLLFEKLSQVERLRSSILKKMPLRKIKVRKMKTSESYSKSGKKTKIKSTGKRIAIIRTFFGKFE